MKQTLKKLSAAVGFLALMLLLVALPGTKADAATLSTNGSVGPVAATAGGEYHKLVMKKDGYVSIAVLSAYQDYAYKSACNVSVYNKSKKRISDDKYTWYYSSYTQQKQQFFALKKGTYYVKVKMSYPTVSYNDGTNYYTNLQNQYHVGSVVKYITDMGATKKSKATTIKLKGTKHGILALTDAKSSASGAAGDWYKFTLTKTTKVRLYIKGISTNRSSTAQSLKFAVYGKATYSKLSSLVNNKTTTLPKGTYYIRVYKSTATDSGYYKIGLNKAV